LYSGVRKLIDQAVANSVTEIKHHFKTDGWDLRFAPYQEDIIQSILGPGATTYILLKTMEELKNVDFVIEDGVIFLKKEKKNAPKKRKLKTDNKQKHRRTRKA
jgi:hypothetical protein